MMDETWRETWKLKALATSVSAELRRQFGKKEFYALSEVQAACDQRHVADPLRACAIAMFVAPAESGDALRARGFSDPAAEMRKLLVQKLSPSAPFAGGAASSFFSFHDSPPSHHGHGFGDSFSGDSGCDGGGGGGGE